MNCVICKANLTGKQTKYCSKVCKNKDTNMFHQGYLRQLERSTKAKAELIKLAGGKCQRCGYYRNQAALHFHHLRDKLFTLDASSLANRKREALMQEFEKCELLCSNCHAEEHYPQYAISIP